MKKLGAIALTAVALASCRSSEPATNPFMRTTVAPPATGQGAVVVDPYNSGAPLTSAPIAQQAPIHSAPVVQPAPFTPAPAPVVTPASNPRDNKYSPPGGSFNYNQSSVDPARELGHETAEAVAAGQRSAAALDRLVAMDEAARPPSASAVNQALLLSTDPAPIVRASYAESPTAQNDEIRFEPDDPRPTQGIVRLGRTAASNGAENSVRVVAVADASRADSNRAEQDSDEQPLEQSRGDPLFRLTADNSPPADPQGSNWNKARATGRTDSQVRLLADTADQAGEPAAQSSGATSPFATRTAARRTAGIAAAPGPAHTYSPDYGTLQGQLEYSQSSRQWKLRYIPIDGQTDSYGGSVVLPDARELEGFQPGQFVAVRGAVTSADASGRGFAPLYRLESIEPLPR